jgi:multicomponent Na+:H+ antiporter subunit E
VNLFVVNLLLMIAWVLMTGVITLANLVLGFVLGFVVLFGARRILPPSPYFTRLRRLGSFIVFYIGEVIRANIRVAYDVVTPTLLTKPAIIAIPLDVTTDFEITLLANLVTMTPGSLSLDVSGDRKVLYVHGMFVDDPEEFRRRIKDGLERRVLELLR